VLAAALLRKWERSSETRLLHDDDVERGAADAASKRYPQETFVYLNLNYENDDAALAQALEQNPYVWRVQLRPNRRNAPRDSLLRVLATRGNLENFILVDYQSEESIRPILQAIQQNTSIRIFKYQGDRFTAQDLCSFLDIAVHVSELTLQDCQLNWGAQGVRDIVAAFQRNTNIETLKLLHWSTSLAPILEGLVLNTSVKSLAVSAYYAGTFSEAARNSLRSLLESTGSIQHLELGAMSVGNELFGPVAQGVINASSVTGITFKTCTFIGEGSIRHLNEILQRKQNLGSLTIARCTFNCFRLPQFLQVLFSTLRRADSPLRHFELENNHFIDYFSNPRFSALCEAVAESKLDLFSISVDCRRDDRFTILADAIPSMKIRELVVQFEDSASVSRDLMKQRLCTAVKNNYTLQSVKYRFDGDGWENNETLQFYMLRNIRLAQWVKDPSTVKKHLWKQAVTQAARAGPETLYCILREVGPAVLPISRKRKRSG